MNNRILALALSAFAMPAYGMNFSDLAQQAPDILNKIMSLKPAIEKLAYGDIDGLRAEILKVNIPSLISNVQSYVAIIDNNLPKLINSLPAQVTQLPVVATLKDNTYLIKSLSVQLENLKSEVTPEAITRALNTVHQSPQLRLISARVKEYYDKQLMPLFNELQKPARVTQLTNAAKAIEKVSKGQPLNFLTDIPALLSTIGTLQLILKVVGELSNVVVDVNAQVGNQLPLPVKAALDQASTVAISISDKIADVFAQAKKALGL